MSCVGLSTAFNGISCMIVSESDHEHYLENHPFKVSVGMGQIVQSTGSYILPFYIGGAMVALAGLLSGIIGIISARRTANGL